MKRIFAIAKRNILLNLLCTYSDFNPWCIESALELPLSIDTEVQGYISSVTLSRDKPIILELEARTSIVTENMSKIIELEETYEGTKHRISVDFKTLGHSLAFYYLYARYTKNGTLYRLGVRSVIWVSNGEYRYDGVYDCKYAIYYLIIYAQDTPLIIPGKWYRLEMEINGGYAKYRLYELTEEGEAILIVEDSHITTLCNPKPLSSFHIIAVSYTHLTLPTN